MKRIFHLSCAVSAMAVLVMLSAGCTSPIFAPHKAEARSEHKLSAEAVTNLKASTHIGRIKVAAHAGPDIQIVLTAKARAGTPERAQKLADTVTLAVASDNGQLSLTPNKPLCIGSESIRVSLAILVPWKADVSGPVEAAGNKQLRLRTSTGDIRVGDLSADLDAHTSTGDVRASRIAGSVKARTSTGDIVVGDISGSANLKSSTGDVRAEAVAGEVKVRTATGDIQVLSCRGGVDASSSTGSVEVVAHAGQWNGESLSATSNTDAAEVIVDSAGA